MSLELRLTSPEAMRDLGRALGRASDAGDRFLLEGPFGAGKTTFVQGLAQGLGIPTPISSPSFVIETQYHGRLTLYHVDLYRLEQVDAELRESLEEHLFGDGVTAVEWAERLPPDLRDDASVLRFEVHDAERVVWLDAATERLGRAV